MIKVVHPLINSEIEFCYNSPNVWAIENPKMLVSIVEQLDMAMDGMEYELRFLEDNKILKDTSKICFIKNIFELDFNNKKLQSALLKKLTSELLNHELILNEVFLEGARTLEQAISTLDTTVTINSTLDITTFLKCYAPSIEKEYDSMLERLVAYINVMVEFADLKCLIFLNLQSYLTKKEMELLYEHSRYKEVALLFIESAHRYKLGDEKCVIIDDDLCEIVE